jgi:hypothetical protein
MIQRAILFVVLCTGVARAQDEELFRKLKTLPDVAEVRDPTNIILAPKNEDLTFNPATMYNVYTWLRDHGNNIIYIYGETDLWGATAMELSGKTNAVKIVKPGGSHRTRIGNLPPEQQNIVYSALEEWLGIKIGRH